MPSKSKRNRRAVSQRAMAQRVITQNTNGNNNPISPAVEATAPSSLVQPIKSTGSYRSPSRGAAVESMAHTYFSKDIKWIGIVSGIIIVLLIMSYYIFR